MERASPKHDLWFRSVDGAFAARLGSAAIGQMLALCAQAGRLETGGILAGRYSEDHRVAVVEVATGPGGDARAGVTWLVRGVQGLQRLLDGLWANRQGYYIGEWHFHPGAPPSPSSRDLSQMRSIASSDRYQCPEPLLVIVGGDPKGAFSMHVEVQTRSGRRVVLQASSR